MTSRLRCWSRNIFLSGLTGLPCGGRLYEWRSPEPGEARVHLQCNICGIRYSIALDAYCEMLDLVASEREDGED